MAWAMLLLGQMLPEFNPVTKRTPLDGWSILAFAMALVLQILGSLWLALRGDPLDSSEKTRSWYVYLAEGLIFLLFLHARLNIPELFQGPLARYWTLVILVIAFAGVAFGELAERRGLTVLATPLLRTGVFLPLVPILAFWLRPPAAFLGYAEANLPGLKPLLGYFERLPWHFDSHAGIWMLTAAIYGFIAVTRRSRGWALVAALTANFGLWAILLHLGISFFVHPQAWLIPLGLILLTAENLHRDQIAPGTSEGLRYLGVCLIYVASTADLFLVGLGKSLWLPIFLALLCVIGVLVGILLRVRAFLFLGVSFLLVDILIMIWHAAVNQAQTWLWWAAGIVLGVAILALFALFEKRRNDVLHLIDDLKQWN